MTRVQDMAAGCLLRHNCHGRPSKDTVSDSQQVLPATLTLVKGALKRVPRTRSAVEACSRTRKTVEVPGSSGDMASIHRQRKARRRLVWFYVRACSPHCNELIQANQQQVSRHPHRDQPYNRPYKGTKHPAPSCLFSTSVTREHVSSEGAHCGTHGILVNWSDACRNDGLSGSPERWRTAMMAPCRAPTTARSSLRKEENNAGTTIVFTSFCELQ